tara:strand:- start:64 stop:1686 length:1623 start_codon:yes stop_codon:yes gene_type:complete
MADNRIQFTFEINDKGKVRVDGLTKSFVSLDNAVNKVSTDLKRQQTALAGSNKGLKSTITDAGLAGATLTELGRTISDSNYGIRGMANNLSQLSTLFITLVSKEGEGMTGFVGALSRLKAQLFGPLGIILAFQAIVALLERYAINQEKAARAAKQQTDIFSEQRSVLKALTKNIREYDISGNALREEVGFLVKESKEFKEAFENLNDFSDETVRNLVREYSRMLELEDARVNLIRKAQEEAKKSGKEVVINSRELKDILKDLNPLQDKFSRKTIKASEAANSLSEELIEVNKGLLDVEEVFDPNKVSFISEMDEYLAQIEADLPTLTSAVFGLTADKRRKELAALKSKFNDATLETKLYRDAVKLINDKYDAEEREKRKREQRAEQQAKFNHYSTLLKGVADFFQASAQLNEQNKTLARAAIIASSAAASVGVWQSYHALDASPKGFLATAGAVAAQLAIAAQTSVALRSLNSGTAMESSGGAESQAPIFNVVGNSGIDQLGQAIRGTRNQQTIAIVSDREILEAQNLRNTTMQGATLSS